MVPLRQWYSSWLLYKRARRGSSRRLSRRSRGAAARKREAGDSLLIASRLTLVSVLVRGLVVTHQRWRHQAKWLVMLLRQQLVEQRWVEAVGPILLLSCRPYCTQYNNGSRIAIILNNVATVSIFHEISYHTLWEEQAASHSYTVLLPRYLLRSARWCSVHENVIISVMTCSAVRIQLRYPASIGDRVAKAPTILRREGIAAITWAQYLLKRGEISAQANDSLIKSLTILSRVLHPGG